MFKRYRRQLQGFNENNPEKTSAFQGYFYYLNLELKSLNSAIA